MQVKEANIRLKKQKTDLAETQQNLQQGPNQQFAFKQKKTDPLVLIDDATADRTSRTNSEAYRTMGSQIRLNAPKPIGRRFTVQI